MTLMTVIFLAGMNSATFTVEFDTMAECQKELTSFVGYLSNANITPTVAKCEMQDLR